MRCHFLSESALVLYFGQQGVRTHQEAKRVYQQLRQNPPPGVLDIILCYSSVGVYYDPEIITEDSVKRYILDSAHCAPEVLTDTCLPIRIPVYYGDDFGPDMGTVAQALGMSPQEVIYRHAGVYTVLSVGFLPGFPYLGPLDPRLIMPRKPVPAVRVPAGSVAIAGGQTGIYPFDSPGGWHVIGWTPVKMFDLASTEPCLLKPGDIVEFFPAGQD